MQPNWCKNKDFYRMTTFFPTSQKVSFRTQVSFRHTQMFGHFFLPAKIIFISSLICLQTILLHPQRSKDSKYVLRFEIRQWEGGEKIGRTSGVGMTWCRNDTFSHTWNKSFTSFFSLFLLWFACKQFYYISTKVQGFQICA